MKKDFDFSESSKREMRNDFLEEYTDRRLKNLLKKVSSVDVNDENDYYYFYVTKYKLKISECDVISEMRRRKLETIKKNNK